MKLSKHGDLTPDEARRRARELIHEVRTGGDPVKSTRTGEVPTVEDLATRFLEEYLPNKKHPPRARTIEFYDSRLIFWTGWRRGEVLHLEWNNLNLDAGIAELVRTKTTKEEYRQLPSEAVTILKSVERVAISPYVFPGRDLTGHLATLKKPWERIRRRAGLDDLPGLGPLRLHDLRHNVVSWDVSRGVALEIAGKNVGHRSRKSTEVYAHFAPDALKRAADDRAQAMRKAMDGER